MLSHLNQLALFKFIELNELFIEYKDSVCDGHIQVGTIHLISKTYLWKRLIDLIYPTKLFHLHIFMAVYAF